MTDHSNGFSASHEFQLTIDKRFSGGFNLRGAYTLSKTIDVQSGFRARSSLQTDPLDPSLDRGLADFDATHRLVISGSWEIPWDKPFRKQPLMRKLTEGWQINGIASFQSGAPFTIFSNDNQSQQASGLDRADLVGKAQTFNARTIRTFTPDANGINGSCLNGEIPEISISIPWLTIASMSARVAASRCSVLATQGAIRCAARGSTTLTFPSSRTSSSTSEAQLGISNRVLQCLQPHAVPAVGQLVDCIRI